MGTELNSNHDKEIESSLSENAINNYNSHENDDDSLYDSPYEEIPKKRRKKSKKYKSNLKCKVCEAPATG